MQHSLFSEKTFARVIRIGDSLRFNVNLIEHREQIIKSASETACSWNASFKPFQITHIKGRPCVSLNDYGSHLVLRSISQHLIRRFKIVLPNRDAIVNAAIAALSDSTPMYIVRRDIKSFYESVPLVPLRAAIMQETAISPAAKHYINSYFETYCSQSSAGIPRGLVLSAVLAEISMRAYDEQVRNLSGVYRYFRYSDDILVFSYVKPVDIISSMQSLLPTGMNFNPDKSSVLEIDKTEKPYADRSIDYLGYKFSFSDRCGSDRPRPIMVSISERKIAKLKTRIILSFKHFKKYGHAPLLLDRMKFLSANYRVPRKGLTSIKSSSHVKSGIFFSYRLCGAYRGSASLDHECIELKRLDGFYFSLLKNPNNEFSSALAALSPHVKARLLRISFFKGFQKRIFVRFPAQRLAQVKAAWINA